MRIGLTGDQELPPPPPIRSDGHRLERSFATIDDPMRILPGGAGAMAHTV